jgi:hypothetical protein
LAKDIIQNEVLKLFVVFKILDLAKNEDFCVSLKRFRYFLDPLTLKEFHLDSSRKEAHVRTIDLNKLFDKSLRHALM